MALASGEVVEGDAVVIAMGPWSIQVARWLPLPAVFGYKGHSLVFETGGTIPAEALFLEYREPSGNPDARVISAPMARPGWVQSQPSGRCASILPTLHLTGVRTRESKRCAARSRRRSPPRPSKHGKRVSGR
jgi:hypothetical protein